MKAAIPLYEFMPYGAPELLESRQPLMGRALLVTSLLALAAFATTGALLARMSARLVAEITPPRVFIDPTPGSRWTEPRLPATPPRAVPRRVASGGIPIPVPTPAEPPVEPSVPGGGTGGASALPSSIGPAVDNPPPAPADDDAPVAYVEELPAPVVQWTPVYPEFAKSVDAEGLVIVRVLVGRDGRVRELRLDEKHHVPALDDAALDAARRWVFTPARVNGHPVATWTAIPFRFTLH